MDHSNLHDGTLALATDFYNHVLIEKWMVEPSILQPLSKVKSSNLGGPSVLLIQNVWSIIESDHYMVPPIFFCVFW